MSLPVPPHRRSGRLPVGDGHEMAWWEHGDPGGLPAVLLHGGPGAGSQPGALSTLDAARFRLIRYDQRGCGESAPHAEVSANTTPHLVADLERLRAHLGIGRWLVLGHSWGSCLALAYALAHPGRVLGLRLSGVFTARRSEFRWWFHGVRALFPEEWDAFADHVPEAERDDLLAAYHRRLSDPDPAVHLPAAVALRGFSARTQTFRPDPAHLARLTEPRAALAVSRLFCHYGAKGAFLAEGELIARAGALRAIPAEIVQARYDAVTPAVTAHELRRALPEAGFTLVTEANHVASEPPMAEALAAAAGRLAARAGG